MLQFEKNIDLAFSQLVGPPEVFRENSEKNSVIDLSPFFFILLGRRSWSCCIRLAVCESVAAPVQ